MPTSSTRRSATRSKPLTHDAYLATLPDEQRVALQKLREAILVAAPQAEECFSYGVPAFRLNGRPLVGYAAAKKHCSFFPMSGRTIAEHMPALAKYDTSKGTIRFLANRPLPAALVRKLVKARIADHEPRDRASRRPAGRRRSRA